MSDLRQLVTTTHRLQEQLQTVVQRLEQAEGTTPSGSIPPPATTVPPPPVAQPISNIFRVRPVATPRPGPSGLHSSFNWNPTSSIGQKRKAFPSHNRGNKKKRVPTWTHTFVCLSSRQQDAVPDGQERAALQIAGLGEKRVTLTADGDVQDIYRELFFHFPQLNNAGGFELMRVPEGGGKQVEIIAAPEAGYSVSYLRAVVHHAKVFIRPLQKDLSLEPLKEESIVDTPKEECLKCGSLISVTALREHMISCNNGNVVDMTQTDSSPQDEHRPKSPQCGIHSPPRPVSPFVYEIDDEVDPVVEVAMHISKQSCPRHEPQTEFKKIADVVQHLRLTVDHSKSTYMIVRRSHVLSDALRRLEKQSFDPNFTLQVEFVAEEGSDTGGLTREFFRLVGYSMKSKYLESTGCFRHDAIAYQSGVYFRLGVLMAMALVHGGSALHLFGPTVYNFLCGHNAADLIASTAEIPDPLVRDALEKMDSAADVETFKQIAMQNIDLLIECGFNKAIPTLQLTDRIDVMQAICLHKVILVSMAELSHFREGLSSLNVLRALKDHSGLLSSYFCCGDEVPLTSDIIRNLFTDIKFSEKGSNVRVTEESAFMMFVDYMDDCERVEATSREAEHEETDTTGSECKISLKMILSFFTGADSIPPLGYLSAELNFNSLNSYPTASTCAIQLTLPTKYSEYTRFKEHLNVAFSMHGGFGLV